MQYHTYTVVLHCFWQYWWWSLPQINLATWGRRRRNLLCHFLLVDQISSNQIRFFVRRERVVSLWNLFLAELGCHELVKNPPVSHLIPRLLITIVSEHWVEVVIKCLMDVLREQIASGVQVQAGAVGRLQWVAAHAGWWLQHFGALQKGELKKVIRWDSILQIHLFLARSVIRVVVWETGVRMLLWGIHFRHERNLIVVPNGRAVFT